MQPPLVTTGHDEHLAQHVDVTAGQASWAAVPDGVSLDLLNFDPTHPILPQEHDDHLAAHHRRASCWKHCVVVQLHPATRCSDVIGQLRYYRHYRFWILVTISACENVTYVRVTTSLTLNKPIASWGSNVFALHFMIYDDYCCPSPKTTYWLLFGSMFPQYLSCTCLMYPLLKLPMEATVVGPHAF